jgi:hypothetical protein
MSCSSAVPRQWTTRVVLTAASVVAAALTVSVATAHAQQPAPKLTSQQRATLEALVTAVDAAAATPPAHPLDDARWVSHVLRASDGSHYVALSAAPAGVPRPAQPVVLYVRFALRRAGAETLLAAPRSAVLEWLKGLRADPLPMRAQRSISVPQGEIPVGGAAMLAGAQAAVAANDASNALKLQELERERQRREREQREKQRRAELESRAATPQAVHAFEDFDPAHVPAAGGTLLVERGATLGPGDYDVYIAWAEPPARRQAPAVHVVAHRVTLPAATRTDFGLSDIVLAASVQSLETPYPVDRQGAHPYALGTLEAAPARDTVFRVDEPLAVVAQVINPAATPAGKPDVEVAFRVDRLDQGREQLVGQLPAQRHHAETLPADFDVAAGHPLFAAVRLPLASFARGDYALTITATDRVAGRQASRTTRFSVAGTAASLLREAPTPGQAFRREAVLSRAALSGLAAALAPATPSPALAQALEALRQARYADLVRAATTEPSERPVAQVLLALGLFGLGDAPRAVAAQLVQAEALGAPPAPVHFLLGATSALDRADETAVTHWNRARDGGLSDALIAPLLVDAYVRLGDQPRAAAMATSALDANPADTVARRALAATHIAARRYTQALDVLDHPALEGDVEARFLRVHALYAAHVHDVAPARGAEGLSRFRGLADQYVAAGGAHAALVQAWLDVLAGAR